jgi:hypothetical protein
MVVYRRNLSIDLYLAGGLQEVSSFLADPIAPKMRGGGVVGSQPMSTAVHTEPPCLTYGI